MNSLFTSAQWKSHTFAGEDENGFKRAKRWRKRPLLAKSGLLGWNTKQKKVDPQITQIYADFK